MITSVDPTTLVRDIAGEETQALLALTFDPFPLLVQTEEAKSDGGDALLDTLLTAFKDHADRTDAAGGTPPSFAEIVRALNHFYYATIGYVSSKLDTDAEGQEEVREAAMILPYAALTAEAIQKKADETRRN